jgi:hypothetical protein
LPNGKNHLLVKGIQVYSYKGSGFLQRGDNNKYGKIGWGYVKNLLKNH